MADTKISELTGATTPLAGTEVVPVVQGGTTKQVALTPANIGAAATSQKLDDFGAPDDNTDLNATTSAHGLLLKATAPGSGLLSVVGIGNGETAYSNKALFDTTNPAGLGTAGPGTSLVAARRDHVHANPALDTLAAPTDNTTLDATVSAHGLLPKLGGGTTNFLRADGTWAAAGGGSPGGSNTQVQFNDSSAFGGDSGLSFNKTTDVLYVGAAADASATYFSFDPTGTIKLNRGSSGGYPQWTFENPNNSEPFIFKTTQAIVGFLSQGLTQSSLKAVCWSQDSTNATATIDTKIYRDAAAILAQRNGTNAQAFRVYNTWTDASNGEWGAFGWKTTSNTLTIGAQANGSGTLRKLQLVGAGILTDATVLPTTNPAVAGQLWNDGGVVKVSTG